MRLLIGVLLISFLAGCGGGSDGAGDIPAKVNTAPVLVGPLNMQLTANSLGETNLAMQDAENDTLTISYTNKPSWVEGVSGNTQLKLTAKPTFFHVGSHQFSLRVSDGKSHSDYTVTLNVSDDPTKWVPIDTDKTAFIGQWSLATAGDLHLYANDTGRMFSSDGEVYELTWFERNGFIEISSTQLNCVADCTEHIEVFVIANDGPRKRLVFESDSQNLSVTAVPYTAKTVKSGTYTPRHTAVDFITTVNGNTVQFSLPLKLEVPTFSSSSWVPLNTQLTADGKLQPQQNFTEVTMYVQRYNQYSSQPVDINVSLHSAEIVPSAENRLTLKYQLSLSLKDNSLKPTDFIGLQELLDTPYIGFVEAEFSEQKAVPQFTFNTPYLSSFRLRTQVDGQPIEFGSSEIVFIDGTKGVARFRMPQTLTTIERDFTWTSEQQQLVITLEGKQYRYSFIQHPLNGLSLVTERGLHFPFLTRDKHYEAQALLGSFLTEQTSSLDDKYYHNIFTDNTATLYSNQSEPANSGYGTYKSQQESDGSITFLDDYGCERTATFAACAADLKRRIANGESLSLYFTNFKIIKQTETQTFMQTTYSYQSKSLNQHSESVTRVLNVK